MSSRTCRRSRGSAQESGALTIVDAVSSLGAVPLETDAWGLDVVVAGSQKALMTPPGLSLSTVSAAAWERAEASTTPRYYFDWARMKKALDLGFHTLHPAVTLVASLDAALGLLLEEGLDNAFARHAALGRACREGAKAMGLELFSPDEERSAVVTAILTPDGVDAKELVLELRDRFGITVAGAHGELGARMFRIGHIGYYDVLDITTHSPQSRRFSSSAAPRSSPASPRAARSRRTTTPRVSDHRPRVLVRERIADSGLELLRRRFDVVEDGESDLASIIGDFDAIIVRSATKLDAALIERGRRLKVIGRVGVGVDNVDVDAATRRGIVVANAAESTVDSAAEHAIALLLALARNVPQAHAALTAGTWTASASPGSSSRARPSACSASAASGGRSRTARSGRDARRRLRPLRVVRSLPRARGRGVLVARGGLRRGRRRHAPPSVERRDRGLLDAAAFEQMKDGVRIVNAARGDLVDEDALVSAIRRARSPAPRSTCSGPSRTRGRCSISRRWSSLRTSPGRRPKPKDRAGASSQSRLRRRSTGRSSGPP